MHIFEPQGSDINNRDTFANEVDYLRYCHVVERLDELEKGMTHPNNKDIWRLFGVIRAHLEMAVMAIEKQDYESAVSFIDDSVNDLMALMMKYSYVEK